MGSEYCQRQFVVHNVKQFDEDSLDFFLLFGILLYKSVGEGLIADLIVESAEADHHPLFLGLSIWVHVGRKLKYYEIETISEFHVCLFHTGR